MEDLHSSTQIHGRAVMATGDFISQLNEWGRSRTPFIFLIDFECRQPLAWKTDEVDPAELLYDFNGFTNFNFPSGKPTVVLQKSPLPFEAYQQKFERVYSELEYGNSFLTNLTVATPIKVNLSLREIAEYSRAKYRLWYKNQFVVFSPECFIRIQDNQIYSYPMKGTIDANLPDAASQILGDEKELAEHVTIVDLIRNDLSMVATEVMVTKFRYIDEVKTSGKNLLQVSSEIRGKLKQNFHTEIGDLLMSLLPAGSISGAPKSKTIEIIQKAEGEKRGYYTGIAGYFDGRNLDSAVLIRFIEQKNNQLYYRSGGGITTQSNVTDEYHEVINKVYVPIY